MGGETAGDPLDSLLRPLFTGDLSSDRRFEDKSSGRAAALLSASRLDNCPSFSICMGRTNPKGRILSRFSVTDEGMLVIG